MNLYKSLIFILYLGIFLGSGFRTPAQSRDSITLYGTLDTVQVIRQRIQHANEANAGARVTHISPAVLQANKTRSLAELLTDHTSIYIKSLGTGALSTASFRGTSASQTRVNWNGINITPPLSGTFDFSQIPVFFTDNINLYYGSSHVKNGTGAIGGMLIGMICQIFIVPTLFVAFQTLQEKFKPMEWKDLDNTELEADIEQYIK